MNMLISIAICTWNRSSLLRTTLGRLTRLAVPSACDWEIVVVNNNCTDDTDGVIAAYSGRLPLKRIFEPRQGLSNARNAAVAAAVGDYIVWTDDDVLVDEQWLGAYAEAFARHPGASFFGGPVDPWFEGEPPGWILDGWDIVADVFATRNLGEDPFMLEHARLPFGANFAVRTVEQKVRPYDPGFGLVRGKIVLGEETQLMQGMLRDGLSGWWVPGARVRHWIPRHRQTLSYVRKYFAGYGRTHWRKSQSTEGPWHARPRWLWRKALQAECEYRVARLTSAPGEWLERLRKASMYWGMIFDGN